MLGGVMSIPVSLTELSATLQSYPWGYLVTVGDDQRAHSLAVPTEWRDGVLLMAAGRSTRANIAARPDVTMVFPHPAAGEYSLILDGRAAVQADAAAGAAGGESVVFTPAHAVLHRPALSS
jgi:hypothetical protein